MRKACLTLLAVLTACALLICGALAEAPVEWPEAGQDAFAESIEETVPEVDEFDLGGDEIGDAQAEDGYADFVWETAGEDIALTPPDAPMESSDSDFVIENGVLKKYLGPNGADVVIPDGVTRIEKGAFDWHGWYNSIVVPASVTTIDDAVFNMEIYDLYLPATATNVGSNFWGMGGDEDRWSVLHTPCRSAAHYQVCKVNKERPRPDLEHDFDENGVCRRCGEGELSNIPGFKISGGVLYDYTGNGGDVVIPKGVFFIIDGFSYRNDITGVVIPDTVQGILNYAFSDCNGLKEVTIPNSVTWLGEDVFADCLNLKQVTLQDGFAVALENCLFENCDSLENIYIPASVTSIEEHVFPHWENGVYTPLAVTITTPCGSYAQKWANENGFATSISGHTPVADAGYAPSCTVNGLTDGSHCAVCGQVLVAQQPIPTVAHTPVADAGYAPSCTVNGLTEGSHCAVCGQVITPQQPIAAPGHTPVYDAGYAPAYGVNGLTDGSHCAVCGTVLVPQQVIPALTYQEVALPNAKSNGTITVPVGEQRLLAPAFAYAQSLTVSGYNSSKPAVASVDASGLVTAAAEGKAKITVTTANKKKATITVKVVDPYKPTGIGIAQGKAITLTVGQPVQLYAALAPETAQATLTWTSNKAAVANVDANGWVVPLGEGKAKITVTTHNKKKATIAVTVVDPNKPLGISISQGKAITLKVGEGVQLWPVMNPATAQSALTWKSGKAAVATVDANGYVAALKKGKAKITVTTYNKKKAVITVNVVE
ncbi:MAG: leucine-rich repeat protein [Clostridia bacterium]|nr:leucine-rich repeat protein [Clostridia bacterium]